MVAAGEGAGEAAAGEGEGAGEAEGEAAESDGKSVLACMGTVCDAPTPGRFGGAVGSFVLTPTLSLSPSRAHTGRDACNMLCVVSMLPIVFIAPPSRAPMVSSRPSSVASRGAGRGSRHGQLLIGERSVQEKFAKVAVAWEGFLKTRTATANEVADSPSATQAVATPAADVVEDRGAADLAAAATALREEEETSRDEAARLAQMIEELEARLATEAAEAEESAAVDEMVVAEAGEAVAAAEAVVAKARVAALEKVEETSRNEAARLAEVIKEAEARLAAEVAEAEESAAADERVVAEATEAVAAAEAVVAMVGEAREAMEERKVAETSGDGVAGSRAPWFRALLRRIRK